MSSARLHPRFSQRSFTAFRPRLRPRRNSVQDDGVGGRPLRGSLFRGEGFQAFEGVVVEKEDAENREHDERGEGPFVAERGGHGEAEEELDDELEGDGQRERAAFDAERKIGREAEEKNALHEDVGEASRSATFAR